MTEGAPENRTRRLGLTALAVVGFAVVTWRGYWMSCTEVYAHAGSILFSRSSFVDPSPSWSVAGALLLLPAGFLIASAGFSFHPRRERGVLVCIGLFFSVLLFTSWLAHTDALACMEQWYRSVPPPVPDSSQLELDDEGQVQYEKFLVGLLNSRRTWLDALPQHHQVSWPWLLTLAALVSLLAIFAAWHRARPGVPAATIECEA